jgi:outer membrane protein assembly factor BamD
MRRIPHLIACIAIIAVLAGCAKDDIVIGNEGPEVEVRKCIKLSQRKKYEDAVQCLEMFKARYPQSREGIEAELMIGDAYFDKKDYLLASESYAAFIKLHPFHPRVDYAYYRRGVALFKESPKAIDRDQQYLVEAIQNLEVVIRRYPDSTYRPLALKYYREARLRMARRNLYIGRFYYRTGEYKAAIPRLMEVALQYKETGLAPKALYMATISHLKLGDPGSARGTYSLLATEYAGDKYTKKAERKMERAMKKEEK